MYLVKQTTRLRRTLEASISSKIAYSQDFIDTCQRVHEMDSDAAFNHAMQAANLHGPASLKLASIFPDTRGPEREKDQQTSLGQPKSCPSISDSAVFNARFWRESVPILVQNNVAVQSANLAVLILIFAQSTVGQRSNHHEKALWHYGRALHIIRETNISPDNLRPAILCCMFFVIFEIMKGDTRAAESHLCNGEKMLFELQRMEAKPIGDRVGLKQELPRALQFLMLQIDVSNLNAEKAGCLEAFIRMATSPDRVPNIVPRGIHNI